MVDELKLYVGWWWIQPCSSGRAMQWIGRHFERSISQNIKRWQRYQPVFPSTERADFGCNRLCRRWGSHRLFNLLCPGPGEWMGGRLRARQASCRFGVDWIGFRSRRFYPIPETEVLFNFCSIWLSFLISKYLRYLTRIYRFNSLVMYLSDLPFISASKIYL